MVKSVRELLEYRELLFNLVKRELKVKYKRSVLGFFWSLLNPILMMLIFTFVFAFILKIKIPPNSQGISSFPAFLLGALLAWNFFNASLSTAVGSIVDNSNLVKKVYFPREILPISIVLANLVNFLLELLVLLIFLGVLGFKFYLYLPLLPVIIIIHTLFTIGVCLIISSLNVYFRDVKHLLGVILLIWFYATPIIYPIEMVPQEWSLLPGLPLNFLYKLNPMTALVLSYRSILYNIQLPDLSLLGYAAIISLITLSLGYLLFNSFEPAFAEEV